MVSEIVFAKIFSQQGGDCVVRKWIVRIHWTSFVALIVNLVIIAVYYNVIKRDHQGPMDWWGILLLVIPLVLMCISYLIMHTCKIDFETSFGNEKTGKKIVKGFTSVFAVIAVILFLPLIIVFSIVMGCFTLLTAPRKKTFSALTAKGYRYQHKNKKYILEKENIKIEILHNLEEYYISFDGGKTFAKVEESTLGTAQDREELKFHLHEYQCAPPLYKQRGDAVPPLAEFIAFLDLYLS